MNQPDYKSLSRGVSQDMSGAAIARRLEILAELYELARTFAKAKNLGPVEHAIGREPTGLDSASTPPSRN